MRYTIAGMVFFIFNTCFALYWFNMHYVGILRSHISGNTYVHAKLDVRIAGDSESCNVACTYFKVPCGGCKSVNAHKHQIVVALLPVSGTIKTLQLLDTCGL